jgi:hypothetical protein
LSAPEQPSGEEEADAERAENGKAHENPTDRRRSIASGAISGRSCGGGSWLVARLPRQRSPPDSAVRSRSILAR